MDEDSGVERRRNNYPRERNGRDRRDARERRPRDSGRLNADIDSYRPGGDRYGGAFELVILDGQTNTL